MLSWTLGPRIDLVVDIQQGDPPSGIDFDERVGIDFPEGRDAGAIVQNDSFGMVCASLNDRDIWRHKANAFDNPGWPWLAVINIFEGLRPQTLIEFGTFRFDPVSKAVNHLVVVGL